MNDDDPDEMYFNRPLDRAEKARFIRSLKADPEFRAEIRSALGLD